MLSDQIRAAAILLDNPTSQFNPLRTNNQTDDSSTTGTTPSGTGTYDWRRQRHWHHWRSPRRRGPKWRRQPREFESPSVR